jgi:hypothetical protein
MRNRVGSRIAIIVAIVLVIVAAMTSLVYLLKESLNTDVSSLLGKTNTYPIVSENDVFSTSYKDGVWCKISDNVVKMVQYGFAPEDNSETILEIMQEQEEFNIDDATVTAIDNSGNEVEADLSVPLNCLDVYELYISYKLSNGGGISFVFYPDYIVTVSKYLYYSDLTADESTTDDSTE